MNKKNKELSTVYWSGLVVPFVICVLVLSSVVVILTSNIGKPNVTTASPLPVPKILRAKTG